MRNNSAFYTLDSYRIPQCDASSGWPVRYCQIREDLECNAAHRLCYLKLSHFSRFDLFEQYYLLWFKRPWPVGSNYLSGQLFLMLLRLVILFSAATDLWPSTSSSAIIYLFWVWGIAAVKCKYMDQCTTRPVSNNKLHRTSLLYVKKFDFDVDLFTRKLWRSTFLSG